MKPIGLVPELQVSDFIKSLVFYTEVLGFSISYTRPEEQFAYIRKGNAEIMLEAPTECGRTWKTGELTYPYGRGINLQIEVEKIDALYERLKRAEIPMYVDMEEKWYREGTEQVGNRQFVIQDPDGYLLRFFQDLGLREEYHKT